MTAHAPMTIADVIVALRRLPAADPAINCAILRIVFSPLDATETSNAAEPGLFRWRHRYTTSGKDVWNSCRVPDYTGSIDAALVLIPHRWRTACANENGACSERWSWCLTDGHDTVQGIGPTAPIALCIAAMSARRSRAHSKQHTDAGEGRP